ncbi:Uncharacterized protein dnm_024140 [Desulfonema magnum]|uniref:Uncharacterized protein n=1 Tax=Desulfonema magnum TaxID=45655 RepID=A0A975BJA0_9BACT|nr:Uncharacterized protein dnm_024140 [Desulfonema magnum]
MLRLVRMIRSGRSVFDLPDMYQTQGHVCKLSLNMGLRSDDSQIFSSD